MNHTDEFKYAEVSMRWYGWGSPIGLGLFLISLAVVAFIVTSALNNLTDVGQKGVNIEEQQQRMNQENLK